MKYKGPIILVVPPMEGQLYFRSKRKEYVWLYYNSGFRLVASILKKRSLKRITGYNYEPWHTFGFYKSYTTIISVRI